jgi:luciferase family oxidoreductase group 1
MSELSVLDLSPITEGHTPADALANTLSLAQHAERLGYNRFWLAEHHNMRGIASAATSVVIGHVAAGTKSIRLGAGGVMLPNHAPLVIAEQFGTLATLFPGRIDLGIGRAPGTDQFTAHALRRTLTGDINKFPQDVLELQAYFDDPEPGQRVQAVPGAGLKVPIWILGSSLYGAQLAAALGLPYAFASHFAPAAMMQAIDIYRTRFEPSEQLKKPYVMLGYNVCAADTNEEAQFHRTSSLQSFLNLRRGLPGPLPAPRENFETSLTDGDRQMLSEVSSCSATGDRNTVAESFRAFLAQTGADELMIVGHIYDHQARLRSFEIAKEAMAVLKAAAASVESKA